jgi:D-alanyl-D-alanine-carboxypeptidase/D-alanyl-D-alanine-endopeptidase
MNSSPRMVSPSPPNPEFRYSNLGFELLGYGLSLRAGLPYEDLVSEEIAGPLHMTDTFVSLSPEQRGRLIQGYDAEFRAVRAWDWNADFGGSGALKSTGADLLTYLDANLHPEKYAAGAAAGSSAATLPRAFAIDHELRADAPTLGKIALAWAVDSDEFFS